MPYRAYPWLFAVYSVLHLAASNSGEWVQLSDLQRPLAYTLLATVVIWGAAVLPGRDPDQRAFLAFLGVLVFVRGGMIVRFFAGFLAPSGYGPTSAILVVTVLGVSAVVGTRAIRRSFAPVTRFLGLMAPILVMFSLAQLASAPMGRPALDDQSPVPASPAASSPADRRPTIYLIVLDKYQGSATLRSYYGFDNTPFERALRDRGFVLPVRPRANYTHTRQAMAALLNWEYLDSLIAVTGPEATDLTPLFQRLENNRTISFLKDLGYEVVYFPNIYEPFRRNRLADLQLPNPSVIRAEFETVWLQSTLLWPIAAVACKTVICLHVPGYPESPVLTDWKFAQLGPLAASTHPRFVLAHLLVPHEPYVYGADCRHIPPAVALPDSAASRAAYLDQIRCVNAKVLAAVDAIRRTAPTPPVILLQADHGNAHVPSDNLPLEAASPAMVRARADIFAAYYVPGAPDSLFYDGMTPVNLLPRVFNHLFGTTFPRLPDRSFWVVGNTPYHPYPIPPDEVLPPVSTR